MTDDDKMIVGAVLLDFSAAFDIIDQSLLLEKRMCYGFIPPTILWKNSYLSNRTQSVFFNLLKLGGTIFIFGKITFPK